MTDSSFLFTKEGFINLCSDYGCVKSIELHKNKAFIEFDNEKDVDCILSNKEELPSFIDIQPLIGSKESYINRNTVNIDGNINKCKLAVVPENESIPNDSFQLHLTGQPIHLGFNVSKSFLIEDSKQFKLKKSTKKCYHLNNDELFGRPINGIWENINKPKFLIHSVGFYHTLKNCENGMILIQKRLGPNTFVGRTVIDNGEPVLDILQNISSKIESSKLLNINDLTCGMLFGAFDCDTKLYGRGYIIFVAGNSANVALSDFGRVINTTKIRVLPESVAQRTAYSFKGYTKDNIVDELIEGKCYTFTAHTISDEKIVFTIVSDSGSQCKIHIKIWEPSVEESGVPYVNFKSGSLVELLELKDMETVFIRSREKKHMDLFYFTWNLISKNCCKRTPMKRKPAYGEIVGYISTTRSNFVRGRIHKYLGNNIFSVKQMHDPIKENVELSAMIELKYEEKCMPVSFINVGMYKALQYPIQHEANEFIQLMKGNILKANFDESNYKGWKTVDFTIKFVHENLNKILFGLVEPLWSKISKLDDLDYEIGNFCTFGNLPTKELENNSTVTMTFVMYYEGIFYMRDKNFGKSFSRLCNLIKEYCFQSYEAYLPHTIGEVCLGQFKDGNWYRVHCIDVKPGQFIKVYAIDTGNIAFLNSIHLKKFPRELLFEPPHVYLCDLDISNFDKVEFDVDTYKSLIDNENTGSVEFTVKKKTGDENQYLIQCPFLENILFK